MHILFFVIQCIEVLLEKFKEKKAAVVQVLKEAVDAVFSTVCFLFSSLPCQCLTWLYLISFVLAGS